MKPDYSEDDPKECVVTKEERIQLLDAQLAQLAREKRQCEHLLPILFLDCEDTKKPVQQRRRRRYADL